MLVNLTGDVVLSLASFTCHWEFTFLFGAKRMFNPQSMLKAGEAADPSEEPASGGEGGPTVSFPAGEVGPEVLFLAGEAVPRSVRALPRQWLILLGGFLMSLGRTLTCFPSHFVDLLLPSDHCVWETAKPSYMGSVSIFGCWEIHSQIGQIRNVFFLASKLISYYSFNFLLFSRFVMPYILCIPINGFPSFFKSGWGNS